MATIKEIAQDAGVSIGTVDRVLHRRGRVSPEALQKVTAAIEKLGYQPNQSAQSLAAVKKKLKIGYLLPDLNLHPYFADVRDAAMRKAQELERYGIQVIFVELDYRQLLNDDYWYAIGSRALELGLDGIVMLAFPLEGPRSMAQRLTDHKVPVVFYNRYYENMDFLAYVGCDYEKAGRMAAGLCAIAVGDDARIVVYSEVNEDNFDRDFALSRRIGLRREFQEHYPNIRVIERNISSNNPIDNYIDAVTLNKQYPDIRAAYIMQSGDYSICEAIYKAAPAGHLPIITHDLTLEQAEYMRKGMITATICQEPEKQGAQPLDILFRYLVYGEEPAAKMQYTNLSIHIAQSI